MKNFFIMIIIILLLFRCTESVDNWKNNLVKEKEKDGWLFLIEQFNGKRLAFLNIYSIEKLSDSIYYVKILWINHNSISNRYTEEIFRSIEDCENNRSAIIEDDISIDEIDISNLDWRYIENDQLHPILCKELRKLKI